MKPIEGQILLSINQYFPTDCLRMAKKSQGMMNLFIENISEKVRKGIMDCDLDSSSLEISNQAQPLFTLTAEEVDIVKYLITNYLLATYNNDIDHLTQAELKLYNRIKQWQDEFPQRNPD